MSTYVSDFGQTLKDEGSIKSEKIELLLSKDSDQERKINQLKLEVEELRKITAPSTCQLLSNQGISRDQEIFLDFDGVDHGEKPVKVCLIWEKLFFKIFDIYEQN